MIISTIVVLERTIVDSDVLSNCAGTSGELEVNSVQSVDFKKDLF